MAKKTSIARWVAGSAVAAVALWSVSALAAAPPPVPATLTQQGRILNTDGTPVSSKVAITFTLYNDATKSAAANVLWTETQNITLDDGYFSAQLGSTAVAKQIDPTLFDGSVLYLGVSVGSDDEMTPRQALTSVPYAFTAGVAATAAVAASVPFAGLTGLPALCPAGQYLKGYNAADGTPACGALSCSVVSAVTAAAATTESVSCTTGEMTGGGCSSTVALTASYQANVCVPRVIITTPISTALVSICAGTLVREQVCNTVSAATITAYATCCTLQ